MSKLYKVSRLPEVTLVKGARSRLVVGDRAMVSFLFMEPGMDFQLHRHESEQIMIVLEGTTRQKIEDREITLRKGDVLVMESNLVHGGGPSKRSKGCRVIDIFVPPRKDYLNLMEERENSRSG